jgi:hydrogenase expression/formation protein HypC
MCLAVPGQIVEIQGDQPESRIGRVRFGGILKDVNLAFVPEAQPGDFILVHVGFAISRIDEAEAVRVFAYLEEMNSDEVP